MSLVKMHAAAGGAGSRASASSAVGGDVELLEMSATQPRTENPRDSTVIVGHADPLPASPSVAPTGDGGGETKTKGKKAKEFTKKFLSGLAPSTAASASNRSESPVVAAGGGAKWGPPGRGGSLVSRGPRPPSVNPVQTHGNRAQRHGLPVDIGVNTDPMPPVPTGSLYLLLWQFLQLGTSFLCWVAWYKGKADDGELPRSGNNAFVGILVLGFIVFFGIVLPLLISTLNDRLSRSMLESKRYLCIFVMWVCFDFPIFFVEAHAFIELGLTNALQGVSLVFGTFCTIVPPWYIYLRKTTDALQAWYGTHPHEREPLVRQYGSYVTPGAAGRSSIAESAPMLGGGGSVGPGGGDARQAFADLRQHEAVRASIEAMHDQAQKAYPAGRMTQGQLSEQLRGTLRGLPPTSVEYQVITRHIALSDPAKAAQPASLAPLFSLIPDVLNPSGPKSLGGH
eukprot:Rhum_TRINITY_DN21635_c0_g1::Rhum_TRINITY_DN21635_c0_g1_i1::g.174453::m.174453